MASTETTAVIRRLLEDDYIHEQIAEASAGVRGAYRRARRLPPEKAVQDQAVYDRVRQAATGLMEAGRHALGSEPPPKPKHRGRKLLGLLVLGATAAVVVWASRRDAEARANRAAAAVSPVPPA